MYQKILQNKEKVIARAIRDFASIDATKSKNIDTWWLRTVPPRTDKTYLILEYKRQKLAQLIKDHRHLSADTEALVARFADVLKVGFFFPGGFTYTSTTKERAESQGLEIGLGFIPEETARKSLSYMASWNGGENILRLLAVDIPDKIMVGILFHELGHAMRHNKNTEKIGINDDPEGSKKYMLEEVEMHKFGDFILNTLTEGRYNKLVDKIATRGSKEKDLSHIIASITSNEQDELNLMFDCQNTEVGKKMLGMQVIFSVAFRLCELRHEGIEEQIAAYRHGSEIVMNAVKSSDK